MRFLYDVFVLDLSYVIVCSGRTRLAPKSKGVFVRLDSVRIRTAAKQSSHHHEITNQRQHDLFALFLVL
jgi:hypothetical protein